MFDVHERLKKDACNITGFLPLGDQTVKYKFSPGAKYGNKKPGKYRRKEIKNVGSGGKNGSFSAMGNKIFCLWCLTTKRGQQKICLDGFINIQKLVAKFADHQTRHGVNSILSIPHQIDQFQFKMYQFQFRFTDSFFYLPLE